MRSLRALLGVALPVALVTLGLRLLLGLVPLDAAAFPVGLVNDRPRTPRFETERLPDGAWVLLTGGSSAHAAFELAALPRTTRKQVFSRGLATDVGAALHWTLSTLPKDRWPSHVVWGVNLASFARRQDASSGCDSELLRGRPDPELETRTGVCEARPWRERLTLAWHRLDPFFAAREPVADALAGRVRGLLGEAGPIEPKPERFVGTYTGRDEAAAKRARDALQTLGAFGPDPIDPVQLSGIALVAERLRRSAIPLTFVLLPEDSATRAAYDPAAQAAFRAALVATGATVVDWHDRLPDQALFDHGHPNEKGRAALSAAFGELVR